MIYSPQGPDFQWYYSNTLNTQPVAAFGSTITPSTTANTYGSWVSVASAASMTQDTYGVYINFNSSTQSGAVRNVLCEMGVDNAGGTSYQSVIPYLLAGNAQTYTTLPGGINYYFPLYIKAGSSVAFRAMSNSTTSMRVATYFYGQPRRPEALRVGSYVDAFGFDTTTRSGTAFQPGTTSEGAWTQLGSATTRSYWWWQAGLNNTSTSMVNATIHADMSVGDATSKKLMNENQYWGMTASEAISCIPAFQNSYNNVASGQLIYGRAQSSTTVALNTMTMVAYGLGG